MQIHYLWVQNYGYLRQAGINLSAEFVFELGEILEGNGKFKAKLSIRRNPEYIDDFFGKSNVQNVTAIIGKNGSGKSSILKYIKTHLPEGIIADVSNDIIAYSYYDENQKSEVYDLLVPAHFDIDLHDETQKFRKNIYGDEPNLDTLKFSTKLGEIEYINYSYFLDYHEEITPWTGLRNLSTAALMLAGRRRILEDRLNERAKFERLSRVSDVESLCLDETAMSIEFFGAKESKKLPFDRPENLDIEIDMSDYDYFSDNKDEKEIDKLLTDLHSINKSPRKKEWVLNNLLIAILTNFLMDERKFIQSNPYYHNIQIQKDDTVKTYVMHFFESMEGLKFDYKGFGTEIPRLQQLSKDVPLFYKFIEGLLETRKLKAGGDHGDRLYLPLTNDALDTFEQFREFYLKIKGVNSFFNFRWRSLSSGEQSYLSFLSRFYHVRYHEHNTLKKSIVILIDEGDACYHPEWQRKFFHLSLEFLSNLFAGHQLQLIYTANTPFLSSDLTKPHVLFIKKNEDGSSLYLSKTNDRAETFAANIHELFANSFYMEGVLIGEFAKNYLNEIIKYINENKEPNERYRRVIEMIGEPSLRRKLQMMWNEKFGLDEELAQLQKRIEEIQSIKNSNQNPGT